MSRWSGWLGAVLASYGVYSLAASLTLGSSDALAGARKAIIAALATIGGLALLAMPRESFTGERPWQLVVADLGEAWSVVAAWFRRILGR